MGPLPPSALPASPPKNQTTIYGRLVILLTLLLLSLSLAEILNFIDQWRRFHVDNAIFSLKTVDLLNHQLILEGQSSSPLSLAMRDGHCHCRLLSEDTSQNLYPLPRFPPARKSFPSFFHLRLNDAQDFPYNLLCDFKFERTLDTELNVVCSASMKMGLYGVIPLDFMTEVEMLLRADERRESEPDSSLLIIDQTEDSHRRLQLVPASLPTLSPTRSPTRKPSTRPPSKIPTRSPSRAPTRTPSIRAPPVTTQVTFSTAVSIQGIDGSMFDAAAQEAFLLVTSQSMEGVPVSALSIISVSDETRRLSLPVAVVPRKELLQLHSSSSSTMGVEYSTTVLLESFGGRYASVDAMISSLNSQVSPSHSPSHSLL
jgi:hypothetical protein